MSADLELDDLSRKTETPEQRKHGRINLDANQEQSIAYWAYGATILLLLLAVPMTLFPNVLLFAAETSGERRVALTPLEGYLCLNSGILLATFGFALLFNVPAASESLHLPSQAQGHPLLVPLTISCSLISLLSYNNTSVGALSSFVFMGSATIGAWGMWTIMFSGTSYISRKTGVDKRTSGFLFGNKAAASSRKKEWLKQKGELQLPIPWSRDENLTVSGAHKRP